MPGKKGDRGRSGRITGCLSTPVSGWRGAPHRGATCRWNPHWKSVCTRFRRWSRAGAWDRLFKALRDDPDFEYVLIDATISKVHADATPRKGGLKLTPSGGPGAG